MFKTIREYLQKMTKNNQVAQDSKHFDPPTSLDDLDIYEVADRLYDQVLDDKILYDKLMQRYNTVLVRCAAYLGAIAATNGGHLTVDKNLVDYFADEGAAQIYTSFDSNGNLVVETAKHD